MYHTEPPTDKTIREWYMNSSRVAACSLPIDMLLSALSVLVVAQSSSEIPEGLMNNPVCLFRQLLSEAVIMNTTTF